jgi:DNA-binding transcriptional MerR regulator
MLDGVNVLLTIGEFSKMTYLSVKALRHYHDVGILEPAHVDPATGYRMYSATQVGTAQAIRRFRELDMPLEHVRAVLDAPDITTRNAAIVAHLRDMQQQLERTQLTVASLQALLEDTRVPGTVELRTTEPLRALAITESVGFDDAGDWCDLVFRELHDALATAGVQPSGPDGALYFDEIFQDGVGTVTAFVPIGGDDPQPSGRTAILELPATDLAILLHVGPFAELDQTYGALGTYVAEHEIGLAGPIRERYLVTADTVDDPSRHQTEVCWPIQLRSQGERR